MEENQPYLPYYLLPKGELRDNRRRLTEENASTNESIIKDSVTPDVLFAYEQIPEHIRTQHHLTLDDAIRHGYVGSNIFKPFDVQVETGLPETMFQIIPQDKENWYERVCSKVASVLGKSSVDLIGKDGRTLKDYGISSVFENSQGKIYVKNSTRKPFDMDTPLPKNEPYFEGHKSKTKIHNGKEKGFDHRAEEYSKKLVYGIANRIASELKTHAENQNAWKQKADELSNSNGILHVITSEMIKNNSTDGFLEEAGAICPGSLIKQLSYRAAESVKASISSSKYSGQSDEEYHQKLGAKIGSTLYRCRIIDTFKKTHLNMLAWLATSSPYSYSEDAVPSSSESSEEGGILSVDESDEDDDPRAPFRRRDRRRKQKFRRTVNYYKGMFAKRQKSHYSSSDSEGGGFLHNMKLRFEHYAGLAVRSHKTPTGKKHSISFGAGVSLSKHKSQIPLKSHKKYYTSSSESSSEDEHGPVHVRVMTPAEHEAHMQHHDYSSSDDDHKHVATITTRSYKSQPVVDTDSSDSEDEDLDVPWDSLYDTITPPSGQRVYVLVPNNLIKSGISRQIYKKPDTTKLQKHMLAHTMIVPIGEKLTVGKDYTSLCGNVVHECYEDDAGNMTINGFKIAKEDVNDYIPGACELELDVPDGTSFIKDL